MMHRRTEEAQQFQDAFISFAVMAVIVLVMVLLG